MSIPEVKIISISTFKDQRRTISFCNDFDFSPFKRFYTISTGKENQIRAWQGDKKERKVFLPLSGKTKVVLVEITDFSTKKAGKVSEYMLDFERPELLIIPGGFANGIQFISPNSSVMAFSDLSLQDSKEDDFRFNKDLFYQW